MGKSIDENIVSCGTLAVGPFEEISVEMRTIRDFVFKLPQGPGEPSTTRHSYVAHSTIRDTWRTKRNRGTISRFKRAYSSLAHSYR